MLQYLVAGYLPDNYDPSLADEATGRDIHALNKEMIAAGVRIYACGLSPASNAKSLRPQPDGGVLITDGPRHPRAQQGDNCCRRQDLRLRPVPGKQRKVAASAARWRGPHHRRAATSRRSTRR
jgi:hypothetical protein